MQERSPKSGRSKGQPSGVGNKEQKNGCGSYELVEPEEDPGRVERIVGQQSDIKEPVENNRFLCIDGARIVFSSRSSKHCCQS